MIEPISIDALLSLTHKLELRSVPYTWGGKCPNLDAPVGSGALSHVRGIDCSGFAQLAAYLATNKKVRLPEGTAWDQHNLLKAELKAVPYSTAQNSADLLIAFIRPDPGVHAGHVWFCWQGYTCESHGGKGVDRRHWNTPVLLSEVAATLVWPHVA